MTYAAVSTTAQATTVYEMSDGAIQKKLVKGFDLHNAFAALRKAMYQPGKGTWFTAEFRLTREGHFSTDFDVDNEPNWRVPIGAAAYARDLRDFPRDKECIPDWLRAAVDES
jgi:hypothetical protein